MFPIPNMPRGWDFPAPAAPGLGTCRVETKIARHLEVFVGNSSYSSGWWFQT